MKFTLFRTPKPKGYRYRPRFYDPKKDEMDRRRNAMERSTESEDDIRYRITSGLKRSYDPEMRTIRRVQARRSNMILVGAIIFLLIVGYFLVESNAFGF